MYKTETMTKKRKTCTLLSKSIRNTHTNIVNAFNQHNNKRRKRFENGKTPTEQPFCEDTENTCIDNNSTNIRNNGDDSVDIIKMMKPQKSHRGTFQDVSFIDNEVATVDISSF